MANVRAGILGTGHSYPEGILTNADLEKTGRDVRRVDYYSYRHQAATQSGSW